jgi:Bifunctional DNA primase/polymerase, N-terminal
MSTARDASFLQAALNYVHQGYPVIPLCSPDHKGMPQKHLEDCQNPGKTPLVKNWQRYATEIPSAEEVRQWWQNWPNTNIGGPTGPLWGLALDVDPRHDGDLHIGGPEHPIPDTVTNLTGGGGSHYIFA